MAEPGDQLGQLADGRLADPHDLVFDRRGIARRVVGQRADLHADHRAEHGDDAERDDDGGDHRERPRQPQPPQDVDQRREHERQQHRKHDRHQHVAREIQGSDDDDADREPEQPVETGDVGCRNLRDLGRTLAIRHRNAFP